MTTPSPIAQDAPLSAIWAALKLPLHAIQVRAWLSRPENRQAARAARGPRGETMLHWAAMADAGLMLDFLSLGLDANSPDGTGASPADWLLERLWMTHREGLANLTEIGKRKLRMQTDELLSALWRLGGRPALSGVDYRAVVASAGLWQTLATWKDCEGIESWQGWEAGTCALHHWPRAPQEQGGQHFLQAWSAAGLAVDVPDHQGRTPLWYAVQDACRLKGLEAQSALAAVEALVEAGANPEHLDQEGTAPLSLPLLHAVPEALTDRLSSLLSAATPAVGLDLD